jgi:arylsulfatase A-like enzyme
MSLACFVQADETPQKPINLIVIMADDMGAKELGCYGNTEHITPNLDRLAETGVQFDTAYSTPICHPTRFMLMTGQYAHHNGVYNFDNRRGGPDTDAPEEQIVNHYTFGKHLQAHGYATALAGKWQLSGELPNLVHETGFDEYRIWAYKHNLPEGIKHTGSYEGPGKPGRYWNPSIVENGKYMPTKPEDYGPDLYTGFLIDFMKRKKDKPFFIYYPMCLTHGPQYHTPDTISGKDKNDGRDSERFKATVEYTDKLVGRIVAALDELGLRDNTLVIFTADNGTGGDGKAKPTELGARVPLIINAPALIKTRGRTVELSDLTDIFPTLADFANAPLPKDKIFDGTSLHDFLVGKTDTHREWIYSYIADRRILRTKRYLLEDNSPLHYGHLFDCGESRNGNGYKEVTDSDAPEVLAIKEQFSAILKKHPAPALEKEGSPSERLEKGDKLGDM